MISVVGGGLGGLISSIALAEAGHGVRLYEASRELGGRARSKPTGRSSVSEQLEGEFRPNFGAHALYSNGELWAWLRERKLIPKTGRSPLASPLVFRIEGRARRTIPSVFLRPLLHRRLKAPVDQPFRAWAEGEFGETSARALSAAAGVFTFHHDPGELAAAFVWERLLRATSLPPVTRYPHHGWSSLVDNLEVRARDLGVEIETNAKVDALPDPPVILALHAEAAESLLQVALPTRVTRAVLVDVGLKRRRFEPQLVLDLDSAGFVENYGLATRGMAPSGHTLLQGHVGLRLAEVPGDGVARVQELLDLAFRDWRDRTVWSRRQVIVGQTGAIDFPGTTWRDRPAVDQGDGVFLVGDQVAAPGLLSEVVLNSALCAAERITSLVAPRPQRVRELL